VNDAEIRARVDVGDGGSFVRLGKNISRCDKQAEYLKIKIDDIRHKLQKADMGFEIGEDVFKLEAQLEKLENQYSKLQAKQEETSAGLTKGMEKGIKSIKRFGFALFGIHSIWLMVSRASSAYLQQDTETANRLQAVWVGLGSFLAPILEKISTLVIKAVKYLNVFIRALTGVDLLARAISKSMDKMNKTAGKSSKTLAGFDELTNIGDTGTSGIDTSWVDAFKDIPIDPTLEEKLTSLGKKIRDIWDTYFAPFFSWMKDNWDGLGKWVGLVIGIIIISLALLSGSWFLAFGLIVAFVIIFWDEIKAIFKLGVDIIWGIIISVWEMVKGLFELAVSIIRGVVSVIVGIFTTGVELIKGVFGSITSTIKGVVDGFKTIFNGIITFITGVFTGNWKKAWQGVKDIFKGIMDTLWSVVKFPLNLIIDGFNALISGINKIKFNVPDWVPLIGGKKWGFNIGKIPKLEVGTNYVASDGLAFLHKGEAVIPKKFNAPEFFGKVGNDDILNKLDKLIETVEEKDMNAYISSKAIGNVSIAYQNQQKRIMGW
jgi:hypothetical protein